MNLGAQESISAVTIQETTSNNILSYLRNNYQSFPTGSLIYIIDCDARTYAALGYEGSAIKLYYPNVNVYFDGLSPTLSKNYGSIYYFKCANNTIYSIVAPTK
jgi:hypothetical protein